MLESLGFGLFLVAAAACGALVVPAIDWAARVFVRLFGPGDHE